MSRDSRDPSSDAAPGTVPFASADGSGLSPEAYLWLVFAAVAGFGVVCGGLGALAVWATREIYAPLGAVAIPSMVAAFTVAAGFPFAAAGMVVWIVSARDA